MIFSCELRAKPLISLAKHHPKDDDADGDESDGATSNVASYG
jgi:hypothetical protein